MCKKTFRLRNMRKIVQTIYVVERLIYVKTVPKMNKCERRCLRYPMSQGGRIQLHLSFHWLWANQEAPGPQPSRVYIPYSLKEDLGCDTWFKKKSVTSYVDTHGEPNITYLNAKDYGCKKFSAPTGEKPLGPSFSVWDFAFTMYVQSPWMEAE